MITSAEYAQNLARRRASFIDYTTRNINENQLNAFDFNNYNNQINRLTSGCDNLIRPKNSIEYLSAQSLDYNDDKRFEDNIFSNTRVNSRSKSPMQSGALSRQNSALVTPHSPTALNWNGLFNKKIYFFNMLLF